MHILDVRAQSCGAVVAIWMGTVERRHVGRPVNPFNLGADRICQGGGHQGFTFAPFPVEVLADTHRIDHHGLLFAIHQGGHDTGVEPFGGHGGDTRVTIHQPGVRRPPQAHAHIFRAIVLRRAATDGHDVHVVGAEGNAALKQHRANLEGAQRRGGMVHLESRRGLQGSVFPGECGFAPRMGKDFVGGVNELRK